MRRILSAVLCVVIPAVLFASDNGYKVKYDGGSLSSAKAGSEIKLYIKQNQIRFMDGKNPVVTVPASAVTEISYGQDVHRRVGTAVAVGVFTLGLGALTALNKSKKHFQQNLWIERS